MDYRTTISNYIAQHGIAILSQIYSVDDNLHDCLESAITMAREIDSTCELTLFVTYLQSHPLEIIKCMSDQGYLQDKMNDILDDEKA